ncbi:MAG: membrane protein [Candidatus Poriferisodalaceae bacterium]|jgi:membrane protein
MDVDLRSSTPPLRPGPLARWSWQLTKDVIDEYRDDGIGDVAASITFWTMLSIPAAVLALVSALSSLEAVVGASVANDVESEMQQFMTDTFADSETLNETVAELFSSSSAGVATVATFVALFTLSRAFAGLIRALDVAYEVEDRRPWWFIRIVAIGLGVGTVLVVAVAATLLAVLPSLPFDSVLRWLTVPGVLVALIVWAATVFHIGPNHRTPWRYDLPGAVVTTIGWLIASQGFAFYVRLSGQGNTVQTGVGAILLALSLMYVLSVVLLLGAELNDVLARRAGVVDQPPSVTARARSLNERISRRSSTDLPRTDG